ncbi:MAG: aspartate kinase [Elusimicrobia bacterium]|nr:aspartate kinase [Elusimicrobiota bacterium]
MKNRKVIVLKFGGSSVANVEKIRFVAGKILSFKRKGFKPVVVVSAPGDMTDELVAEAERIAKNPLSHKRELDMLLSIGEQKTISLLAMALLEMKQKVISFTGHQLGIITDRNFTNARIRRVSTRKLFEALKRNYIVIVAGFQGKTEDGEITTLGRGGSDLTAVALASTLKVGCKIFTDVPGIFTANPRLYKKAKKIDIMSFEEMLEMAGAGAGVMQARAVELAKNQDVSFEVASTFANRAGTFVCGEDELLEEIVVRGVTEDLDQVKVSIVGVPDRPGIAAKVFESLTGEDICVDMIIQSSARRTKKSRAINDISFTVKRQDAEKTKKILETLRRRLNAKEVIIKENIAKVSIVGSGMRTHSGVASRMFSALARKGINIEMISTSEIKISCVIEKKNVKKAVEALAKEFNL